MWEDRKERDKWKIMVILPNPQYLNHWMGDLRQRITARAQKAAKGLAAGKNIQQSLLEAGYSEHTSRQGRAVLSMPILKALAKENHKAAQEYAMLGKTLDPGTQEDLVRGMLAYNVIKREDKGVLSAKALGSDRRVNMFTPDIQTGIVIINPPPQADKKILDKE